jgi:hypothetical protein
MIKASTPKSKSRVKLLLDVAEQRMRVLYEQGRYNDSLDICLQIVRTHPENCDAWICAAANCGRLGHWQDTIRYGCTALAHGGNTLNLYDILAHGHGELKQWDEARRYGLQALNMRASHFRGEPIIPLKPTPIPQLPSVQTRERNIIAFSLFGGDSKYCESAVLNVQEQPRVYPHWICRFYVDGSVPESILTRLQKGGAQIVRVEGSAALWPGPMWRLLALQDPQAHRILLRDADAVISRREAAAVDQWLVSGKRFHMMRDWSSHTELMMAGLWGVVAGSLPPLERLMQRFMSTPLESTHFADQHFLRQYIWPYARANMMQHDSVFGFMDALPFPDGERPAGFHVGYAESLQIFTIKVDLPNGLEVTWDLYRIIEKLGGSLARAELICSYPATVKDGTVSAHIPARYTQWIEQGTARVRLSAPTMEQEFIGENDETAKIKARYGDRVK